LARASLLANIESDQIMKRASDISLHRLAHRYRELENAGHADGLLTVVCVAAGVALAGAVLLAFVPTYLVLIIALVLAIVATAGLLVTILAMLGDDDGSPPASAPDEGRPTAAGSARR
jgi:MFS family permease